MRKMTNEDFIYHMKKNSNEVIGKMVSIYTEHVLDPIRHELWMVINQNGEMSLITVQGYGAVRISNDPCCFIFSCGGENMKARDLLPNIDFLLGENLDRCIDEVSYKIGKDRNHITIGEMWDYIEEKYPFWIDEWLDSYYSDPWGHIESGIESIFERRLDSLYGAMD